MRKLDRPVYVTRPSLPPLEEFYESLQKIWENKILTNNGPFHQQFEQELADYLGVKYISVFSNGTLALITALQALRISGEVITTPFSFVATTHSLWWNNIKPVFADIDPVNFNLDPEKVEAAITPQTTAIMPVHVYGNPCNIDRFRKLADTYGLKIIYDAAHAFGVKIKGNSVLNFGDLSILSFHATKVFNTIEGGAIVSPDDKTKKRIDHLKNFGFENETTVIEPGINAKMNEVQAAYGLLQLKYADSITEQRRNITEYYRQQLHNLDGIRYMEDMEGVSHNYSYFPVLVDPELFGKTRDEIYEDFKMYNIFCRRYFYPLISQFPTYRGLLSSAPGNLPNAEQVAAKVICLPVYHDLGKETIKMICDQLKEWHNDKKRS
jgi:dTDP-4-amino-4,6-dideoxygalactose transaminase